ncbi:MAG: glutamyl-tRNA reductase [Nitrospirae bacterium CG_4_10_14_0_8_um_filter_41_23]|nr:glutamyl-tRNA reductase [Nitrospirota bacterium]OIP61379.1 MAG: glutamyl-tRNA reductase [Nitrospirae bacterium CG2_30_41_42]PIQ94590.1 MAG: glutamyl-tRNA reductase [Nitrospirae bacterium CG11_big_fil_rev_8_21_14_0_20_41_14]PIV41297.1 MAG: glutamyl-tRNA reductase [Nitrospirae bacterium CG02_land_8_20_14_3_00_41_53]PIW87684.1 MAG: glutamyl-tRNA reductase [Nitrospirae bacterium CG_4_8_14_3_um_filter_41_47]PIY86556.1 MAG: glutamyl-tRNA reductase [Nitrospirae bacterium CG_4_10_14_0_8_um_filter_4
MKVFVAGLNHKTADVDTREKFTFNGPRLEEGLIRFKELPDVQEAVILSTCNRVELYANVRDTAKASESIRTFLSQFHNINRGSLDNALYIYDDINAVRHIFRVASSLDSMVVGEPQILGQLKDAFELALRKKTTGILLNRLMKKAISVAKRVRTETRIAENAVSISFAAVELARKIFTDLPKKVSMLLGAGEMAELAARHLIGSGVKEIIIANRTYDRGCELAKEFNGKPVKFDEFIHELVRTDIVICSTGASNYVLMKSQMQKAMKERKQKPVFIIDISVPRNIDPEINDLDNVYLYNIDDLQGVVDANMFERQKEAEKAEKIIEEEIETFLKWQLSLDSVPTIIALREKAEEIKKQEIDRLLNKIPEIGEKEKKAIEYMAAAIINKLIHPPTVALKEDSEDKDTIIATIRRLYGIDGEKNENK